MRRTWTLCRHEDSHRCVLVVAPSDDDLDELAQLLGGAGYFAFAAVPAGLEALCVVAAFDLIVVLGSVGDDARAIVRDRQPRDQLVELASDDRTALVAAVIEHLPR